MSLFNWHDGSGRNVTADQWQIYFKHETPYCKICKSELDIRAYASTKTTTHFAHPQNSNCPTLEANSSRYLHLKPISFDYENAKRLKSYIQKYAYETYLFLCELVGGKGALKYSEFTMILKYATQRKIWFYKGLTPELLPYVLLVNYGDLKQQSERNGRDELKYYAFNTEIKEYYDLWIHSGKDTSYIYEITPKKVIQMKPSYLKGTSKIEAPSYFKNYVPHI
ncbi:competence protein CoiA family protein [Terribacillus sp. JSM ZJ617]|uniref:competence protein CoiA family protein n=1 Tax=Terribacillus TaxID=459532 RepID=UPI0035A84A3F